MGKIKAILAIDSNYGIGYNNDVLFKIKNDFKIFKEKTSGSTVVMGSKTYDSIGKPLPNRKNIVLSRNLEYLPHENVIVSNDIMEIVELSKTEDIWIIGGSYIYKEFEPFVDEMHITFVHCASDNVDTYYKPNLSDFICVESQMYYDEKINIKYTIAKYEKK